jgi:sRNA-binding protein
MDQATGPAAATVEKVTQALRLTRRAEVDAVLEKLAQALGLPARDSLPSVFQFTKFPRVLKRGIHEDLVAAYPASRPEAVSDALRQYTRTQSYLIRLVKARHRHDLACKDVATITDQEKWIAIRMFAELHVHNAQVTAPAPAETSTEA